MSACILYNIYVIRYDMEPDMACRTMKNFYHPEERRKDYPLGDTGRPQLHSFIRLQRGDAQ